MGNIKDYFFIVFVVCYIAFFIILYLVKNRIYTKRFKRLSEVMRGSLDKFSLIPTFKGEYQGLKFSLQATGATRSRPPYLKLFLNKSSSFNLHIHKESALTGAGKMLGVFKEIKIDDDIFDREFFIFSDKNANVATAYLRNPNTRTVIKELFELGFDMVIIGRGQIFTRKSNFNLDFDLTPEKIGVYLQRLSSLAQGL